MQAPLGYFDANASGLIRSRLDAAAADTETLLAHNLADIVGTITLFLAMLVLMFVFDWRMGAACLLAAVISILAMFSMMGGKNAGLMAEYQAAPGSYDQNPARNMCAVSRWSRSSSRLCTLSRHSSRPLRDYSTKAEHYQGDVCRVPQSVNLTLTEGRFSVPGAGGAVPGSRCAGFR